MANKIIAFCDKHYISKQIMKLSMDFSEVKVLESNKLILTIIAAGLIAALVAGGGAYAYEKSQADATQKDLQAQVNSLKT